MDPKNIAAIAIAGISALTSIATVAYVKYKSSFGDQQDTSLKMTNNIVQKYSPDNPNQVIEISNSAIFDIKLGNHEQFKNGKQELNKINTVKKPAAETESTPLI